MSPPASAAAKLLLAAAVTCSPTASAVTVEELRGSSTYRGVLECGVPYSGFTDVPGVNNIGSYDGDALQKTDEGKDSNEHFWRFISEVDQTVTFDSCATNLARHTISSSNNNQNRGNGHTYIQVFPQNFSFGNGVEEDDYFNKAGCRPLNNNNNHAKLTVHLPAGSSWFVVMEGQENDEQGTYELSVSCTPDPTPAPTTDVTDNYCEAGYDDIGVRWNYAIGKITITATHETCSARCTQYAGREFLGGCKGFMTGMYSGMLFCRSYGGNFRTTPCAPWAHPSHAGMYSGALGWVDPRTNTQNVGGRCCQNITFVPTATKSASSSVVATKNSSVSSLILAVLATALVCGVAFYVVGRRHTPAPGGGDLTASAANGRSASGALDASDV